MQMIGLSAGVLKRLHVLGLAVVAAAILHILATLAAPQLSGVSPFARLTPIAPLHKFEVLGTVTPQAQPLPFLAPDMRYAVCRFDTSKGPVAVSANLPGRGWMLSLYTTQGDNFFTAVGQDAQATDLNILLTPTADRFLGLTPEARGKASEVTNALTLTTGRGMAVLRAPDRGIAYRAQTEATMKRATCTARPF
jgi:uncharacterized membrane protein